MGYEPSFRAKLITRRTYNRPLNDDGTVFETWDQTVDRVIGHQKWLWQRAKGEDLEPIELAELEELQQLMLDRKAVVSGRTLWLGGTSIAKLREASQFNCSALNVDDVYSVVDSFWLLLQGCGVGFRPIVGILNGFTKAPAEIEVIRSTRTVEQWERGERGNDKNTETFRKGVWHLKIGDSAEAWAKSVGKLLAQKKPFKKLILDFSEIRAPGIRLKGYGWISSGDETFSKAMVAIARILANRAGKLLTRVDLLDIMNWLGTTLSSRRAAEICVFKADEPEAEELALAKRDYWINNPQRSMSNNTMLFYQKPSRLELKGLFQQMIDAGGSEPGFLNGKVASQRAPWFQLTNPCVTGDTQILTDKGYVNIGDVVGKPVNVWNGVEFSETVPFSTGVNPLVDVHLSDGTNLICTPYHKFVVQDDYKTEPYRVEAQDLVKGQKLSKFEMPIVDGTENYEGDAYSQGFYSGDGSAGWDWSWVYEPKFMCRDRLEGTISTAVSHGRTKWVHGPMKPKGFVPVNGSVLYKRNWIAGLLDADGTTLNYDNGVSIQLTSIDREFLNEVRLMLTTLGVQAKVVKGHPERMTEIKGEEFHCQESFRLLINCADVVRLTEEVGVVFERLNVDGNKPQRDARRFVTVTEVVDLDRVEETFCFTEPKNHTGTFNGIVTGQCGEILLGDKSFCNLVEIDWGKFLDDFDGLLRAIHIAARANYRQTCVNLKDGVLSESWHELNEFLRLCGVGGTGIVKWLDARFLHSKDEISWKLRTMRNTAVASANSMADELGLPHPKAVTTIKPSGTLSKIMDTTEGCHRPLGKYIFNNVQFSKHDPLVEKLREANYYIFENPYDSSGVIVRLPVSYEDVNFTKVGDLEINTETAIEQLERYKLLMDNYVDHNCSITVSYDPSEVPEIIDWLDKNWDTYVGVSWLFRNDPTKTADDLGHPYLPQEVVTKEVFEDYLKTLLPVDIDQANFDDLIDDACSTGACPVR